jgi:hypothetical protein
MRTLIEIERNVWGKVKSFATVHDLSLSKSVELLVSYALGKISETENKLSGGKSIN